jgi:hypothetical protein
VAVRPAAGSLLPAPGRNNSDVGPVLEAWLAYTGQLLGGVRRTTYLLSGSGTVTPTTPLVTVDWASGATSGVLNGIAATGLPAGTLILLKLANAARPITVKHNVGGGATPIQTVDGQDLQLVSTTQMSILEDTGTAFQEIHRFFGTATASFKSFYDIADAASFSVATQAQAIAGTDDVTLMSPLKARQALVNPGWLASLPITTTTTAGNWLLLYDGTRFWRLPVGTALLGAPHSPAVLTAALPTGAANRYAEVNHGLGAMPSLVTCNLRATSADANYGSGIRLVCGDVYPYWDSTKVGAVVAPNPSVYDGSAWQTITPGSWQIEFHCFV